MYLGKTPKSTDFRDRPSQTSCTGGCSRDNVPSGGARKPRKEEWQLLMQ